MDEDTVLRHARTLSLCDLHLIDADFYHKCEITASAKAVISFEITTL